jgi:hypothetical protein
MNYLRNLFIYFENVLHPASGWSDSNSIKRKKTVRKNESLQVSSPECFNLRGSVKKQDKLRRSPAP